MPDERIDGKPRAVVAPGHMNKFMRRVSNIEGSDRHERYGSTWLTQQGYQHVRNELNSLLLAYRSAEYHHNDPQALEEREWQERRIWQLQELLLRGSRHTATR